MLENLESYTAPAIILACGVYFLRWLQLRIKEGDVIITGKTGTKLRAKIHDLEKENQELKACVKCKDAEISLLTGRLLDTIDARQLASLGEKENEKDKW